MNKVILILVILFSPVFSKAWSQGMYEDINTDESGKVYICTNSGKEISAEQFRSINRYFIKKIFESDDTVRITLKGPGETRASYRELVNSYAADLKINGARCKYLKQELRESTPKTSQYNYTDSCFYLTFLLGHEFQTKGDMAEISAFLVTDSLPVVGKRYPVKPLIVDSSDPVKEWMRPTGDMGVVQVTCYPRCKDVLPLKHITPENKDKRVILSTTDVNGEIEITNVVKLKKSDIYKIDLKLNVRGIIRPDYFEGFEYPVEIKDGGIRLYQVENADLKPCFFPIDNVWPERFVSDNTGRTVKVKHTKKK